MKKLKILFMLVIFIIPISVNADHTYNIDMDIYIDKYGNANIVEVWDVKADSGSEWYKTLYNLDYSELSNFVVYMDGNEMQLNNSWNVNGSLSEKAGYYGINNTVDGIELCFGKGDMNRHKFTLKYRLSNYIFNTDDSQVLYWTLITKNTLDNFTVDITSYYDFPNTLDVWGYGYKGYAYVNDGKISMSNEGSLYSQDVILLAKFPLNTFLTELSFDKYNTFDDVYKESIVGSFEYDYDNNSNVSNENVLSYYIPIIIIFLFVFFLCFISRPSSIPKYGYKGNNKINKKKVPMFRDIPCNKDIYYANTLFILNDFKDVNNNIFKLSTCNYSRYNIFGAIILKWVKNNQIVFRNRLDGKHSKYTYFIDLRLNPVFDNELEKKLFKMMYESSNDGYLEIDEFEKWCIQNSTIFFDFFDEIHNNYIAKLMNYGMIYKENSKREGKSPYVMNEQIYNDSIKLYGLKKYLENFSKIHTKEVMDVKLWDEYLIFAYLFGIADKVAKQLNRLYPKGISQNSINYSSYIDKDIFKVVDNFSKNVISSMEKVRTVSSFSSGSYSSSRGGYSSGGGGRSRGGGGGGSRGRGGSSGGR